MKLKKKDKIIVIRGKDRGRKGTIDKVYEKQGSVLVQGINTYKKHIKKTDKTPQGGVVELARPLDVSKVAIICPHCKNMAKIGYEVTKKAKLRICKKCREKI